MIKGHYLAKEKKIKLKEIEILIIKRKNLEILIGRERSNK